MKTGAYIVVLGVAILFCELLLPWWILVLPSFTVTYSFHWKPIKAFFLAFSICLVVTLLHILVIDWNNQGILSERMGAGFAGVGKSGIIGLSILVPAILSSMGALTASLTPRLFHTTN